MRSPPEPDLELRGKLMRSLGALREMLPGSFVERKRACGRPNCHCADGKRLHSQFQISLLIDGKPKALNIPAQLVEKVREKIEMRRRFDAAAATICGVNLKRFLKEKLQEKEIAKVEPAPAPVRGLSRQGVWLLRFGERSARGTAVSTARVEKS